MMPNKKHILRVSCSELRKMRELKDVYFEELRVSATKNVRVKQ
jgi:hypothetical protein